MKHYISSLVFFMLVLALSSCSAIGTIFKSGVWTGVILVVLVIGLLFYFLGGRKGS